MNRTLALMSVAIMVVAAGCQTSGQAGRSPLMAGSNDSSATLTPEHIGKRVRLQLRTGGAAIMGTVREVNKDRDVAVIELNHGHEMGRLGLRLSQILWVEELTPGQAAPGAQEAPADRTQIRFGQERERDPRVQVIYVDFRHQHGHEACLLDMAEALRDNPSSVIFADDKTKATLSVPVPADPNASLISWQWHAHVLTGAMPKLEDRLELMNNDGRVVVDFKTVALPATLLLVGTPMRIVHKESKLDALAPPRVVVLRVLRADGAEATLRNNPELVSRLDSGMGTLWVAAQPASENEMMLSLYDPAVKHGALMPATKFSVQDALLIPGYVLDVENADGAVWQRVGGYPIPPFLSQDSPDTCRINLEIEKKKIDAGFAAPAQISVRVPERAALKADVDVRVYGVNGKVKHRLILASGRPDVAGKELKFRPSVRELDPAVPHQAIGLDFSKVRREAFPAQVFVWHHVVAEWNVKGGYLPPEPALLGGPGRDTPKRRMLVHPAPFPHLKFIKFEGGVPDLDAGGAGGVLASSGFVPNAGSTIGWGGPWTPFSFQVGTTLESADSEKNDEWSKPPIVQGWANAFSNAVANARARAGTTSSASAVAIANCCGGCGGGGEDKPGPRPDPNPAGGTETPGHTPRGGQVPTGSGPGGYAPAPTFTPGVTSGYQL